MQNSCTRNLLKPSTFVLEKKNQDHSQGDLRRPRVIKGAQKASRERSKRIQGLVTRVVLLASEPVHIYSILENLDRSLQAIWRENLILPVYLKV